MDDETAKEYIERVSKNTTNDDEIDFSDIPEIKSFDGFTKVDLINPNSLYSWIHRKRLLINVNKTLNKLGICSDLTIENELEICNQNIQKLKR